MLLATLVLAAVVPAAAARERTDNPCRPIRGIPLGSGTATFAAIPLGRMKCAAADIVIIAHELPQDGGVPAGWSCTVVRHHAPLVGFCARPVLGGQPLEFFVAVLHYTP